MAVLVSAEFPDPADVAVRLAYLRQVLQRRSGLSGKTRSALERELKQIEQQDNK